MSNDSSNPAKAPHPPAATPVAPVYTKAAWGPAAAIIGTALAMLGAYAMASILAYLLPTALHWSHARAEDWFNSVAGQFVFVVLAESVIVAIVLWFLHSRKASIRAVGFHRRIAPKDVLYVAVTFGAYFIAVALATSLFKVLFHIDLDAKQELGFDTVISNGDKILTFMSLVIIPPLVEEFLFRGFLFTGLRTKLPFLGATVLTSLLFASLHLAEGSGGVLWVAGIDTFILSLFLCYLREKTGNLWAGILLHGLKNGVAFLYLYVFVAR